MAKVDGDTIVVGLDASPYSEKALEWATEEAKRSGRRLLLVNVWHWSAGVAASPMALVGAEDAHTAGRQTLQRAARHAEAEGVPVATHLAEGSPAATLTEMAEDAAMLVVGRRGYGAVRHSLMGSVSKGCVEHSRCPVVVVTT